MGSFSVGERNKMLDAVSARASYTAPAAFYAQLHTADPGAAGTTAVAANTTRTLVTFGSAASAGAIANTAAVTWTAVPTAETYTHVSYWSASSAGTFLGSDDLSASATMAIGENFSIPIGSLTLGVA
jgi:hypothetical protein